MWNNEAASEHLVPVRPRLVKTKPPWIADTENTVVRLTMAAFLQLRVHRPSVVALTEGMLERELSQAVEADHGR